MIKCLAFAFLFPFLLTICGPRVDPNLHKDKRGDAIKLVQDSPGHDGTHKVIDFTTQTIGMLRAAGTPVVDYGWSAELVTGSKDEYNVRFTYKERDTIKDALWTVNVDTKDIKIRNPQ